MAISKKKEDIFFILFKDFASELSIMSKEFENFFSTFSLDGKAAEIMKDFESQCDSKRHTIMHHLNDSFVTPFDREDIFTLAGQLDDISDYMEDTVCKFGLYNIDSLHEDARQYVSLIVQMTAQINELFEALPGSKNERKV